MSKFVNSHRDQRITRAGLSTTGNEGRDIIRQPFPISLAPLIYRWMLFEVLDDFGVSLLDYRDVMY